MKVIGITGNCNDQAESHVAISLMADSSILLSNKPFFVPDFAPQFVMHPAIALRVNRLGKNVASRFAHRYYDSVAACVAVEACGDNVDDRGDARFTAFDGAVMLGDYMPWSDMPESIETAVAINDAIVATTSTAGMSHDFDHMIELVSTYFTLKMGDIIVNIDNSKSHVLTIGQNLTATIGGKPSLKIRIK